MTVLAKQTRCEFADLMAVMGRDFSIEGAYAAELLRNTRKRPSSIQLALLSVETTNNGRLRRAVWLFSPLLRGPIVTARFARIVTMLASARRPSRIQSVILAVGVTPNVYTVKARFILMFAQNVV